MLLSQLAVSLDNRGARLLDFVCQSLVGDGPIHARHEPRDAAGEAGVVLRAAFLEDLSRHWSGLAFHTLLLGCVEASALGAG